MSYFADLENKLLSHEVASRNAKLTLWNERNLSEKSAKTVWLQLYNTIEKAKLYRQWKDQHSPWVSVETGINKADYRGFLG